MSDHYLSLKETAKSRYRLKLQLLGISLENDPYISGNANFQDNMTAWPPVEYGHIFGYFIRRPGVYTQEQLLSWKQLDSYNYFTNGYVRTVMVWDLKNSSSCKVLKAFVNPSQNAPASGNTAWVAVKEDGEIVSAHCTCMAGYAFIVWGDIGRLLQHPCTSLQYFPHAGWEKVVHTLQLCYSRWSMQYGMDSHQ